MLELLPFQEYTGALPPEIPLVPGEPVPQVRKRVGTEFSLSPKFINRDQATEVMSNNDDNNDDYDNDNNNKW